MWSLKFVGQQSLYIECPTFCAVCLLFCLKYWLSVPTEFDAQNAGNGIFGVQISKIFRGNMPDPPSYATSFIKNDTVRYRPRSAPGDMLKTDRNANIPTKKIKSLYGLYQLTQLIGEGTRLTMTTSSVIDYIVKVFMKWNFVQHFFYCIARTK